MVEPTESESKQELDRFAETLIAIKQELEEIKAGKADKSDNVIKNAPHTAAEVTGNEWKHSYDRQKAAFPLAWIGYNKFWPTVSKIDSGYGDRNLVCSCAPIEDYL
jgi:glycine dehydrogenase